MPATYPTRIVCLTEETTETLYLLGEEARIVGISGFTVRPPRARREKPKVSAFTSAKIEKIVELRPDLVLGFSDLQADIAAELIRAGIEVHVFNHRSVAQILRMIATLGALVGCPAKAAELVEKFEAGIEQVGQSAARFPRRPRVYFEEWDDPQISGIRWVSELVGIAGGDDVFPERAASSLGATPVNGVPPSHPSWDRVWSAATDLGIMVCHAPTESNCFGVAETTVATSATPDANASLTPRSFSVSAMP